MIREWKVREEREEREEGEKGKEGDVGGKWDVEVKEG